MRLLSRAVPQAPDRAATLMGRITRLHTDLQAEASEAEGLSRKYLTLSPGQSSYQRGIRDATMRVAWRLDDIRLDDLAGKGQDR